jgi:hypothetical protein
MSNSVDTGAKQKPAHLFKPGQSGNPAGRPKGARSHLSASFLDDLKLTWSELGLDALRRCAATDPGRFCQIVAGLLPRDVRIDTHITVDPGEFIDRYRAARTMLGNAGAKVIDHDV